MKDYKIQKGDTLEIIAKKHGMSLDELIELNKIKDRTKLGIGNNLKVKENGKD